MPTERPCLLCGSAQRHLLRRSLTGGLELRTVICLDCGLVYDHPMPTEQERLAALGGRPACLHCPGGTAPGRLTRRARGNAARYVAALGETLTASRTLLDVGCGEGALLRAAAVRGLEAVGVEPDPQSAATARAVSGAEVFAAPFGAADLGGRRFDLVTVTHVLEHVGDPLALLGKARALLAQGGALFVEVPNVMRPQMSCRRMFPPAHLVYYSPVTLVAMLRQAGLRAVQRRVYRRECVSVLARPDPNPAGRQRLPGHAEEVLAALRRHRWAYYAALMFGWRKVPWVRDRVFYAAREERL